MLAIASASDGGGSIRIPASFCHLFGHKPSRGLLPDFFGKMDPVGISTANCVCHTVEDSAAMLDVLAGRRYDPRTPPADSLLARSRQRPARFTVRSPVVEVAPEVAAAVERAAAQLAELGHHLEEGELPEYDIERYIPVFGRVVANAPVILEGKLQASTRWIRKMGRTIDQAEARRRAAEVVARIDAWWGETDLWLLPSVARPEPRVGEWAALDGEGLFRAASDLGAFTAMFNFGGNPAASVPAGLGPAGLPLGVQLVGQRGADALVLATCRELEEAHPWGLPPPPARL
jgi:amidase